MYTRHGSFLDEIDQFDPQFFGISPREAELLDPQQRLLLEVTWEALEHAGLAPERLAESKTGVFMGLCSHDYEQLLVRAQASDLADQYNAYVATGNAASTAVGRISYSLGLQGPNMAIDTACSSSLVAIHQACRSLQSKESDAALAGGVNAILAPDGMIQFSKARMLSPEGHCKTFDVSADGFVRGEGCGVVVLKRLSDAQRDGDNILAVIRSSVVNQDGASSGLTVPNGVAQERLIREALSKAKLTATDIDYIETHGTGTALGDPIEVNTLGSIFSERTADHPLIIGAVKANIGHLEAASGIAGLIKVVMAMQHEIIPPQIHFKVLNPHIQINEERIRIPRVECTWGRQENRRRRAGVSSFGFSGTNAHVIVEEAPPVAPKVNVVERPLHLLTLSAKTEQALQALVDRYQTYLQEHPEAKLADMAYTANVGRSHFKHRLAVVAKDTAGLAKHLASQSYQQGVVGATKPKLAFLFTGQGSQYVGMGQNLYETQPVFRQALEHCAQYLSSQLDKPLIELLFHEKETTLDKTQYTQPVLFALEYALFKLWESFGVVPDAVLGHSVGEYVAAVVAGVMTLEEGLRLIAARGRLMQALPAGGGMLAIRTSEAVVQSLLNDGDPNLSPSVVAIAAINSPHQVVISGQWSDLDDFSRYCQSRGIETLPLAVSHAFHSHWMEPMLAEFKQIAETIEYQAPRYAWVSNVTGQPITKAVNAEYWVEQARTTVHFQMGMQTLNETGCAMFLEVGPKPVLLGLGAQCITAEETGSPLHWLASLRQGRSDWEIVLESLATLEINGIKIDWESFHAPFAGEKVVLPTYPFQRQRYWAPALDEQRKSRQPMKQRGKAVHPLLGQAVELANQTTYEQILSLEALPYLQDHQVLETVIFPGAGYVEMMLAAGQLRLEQPCKPTDGLTAPKLALENLSIESPLALTKKQEALVQVILTPKDEDRDSAYGVAIYSQSSGSDRQEESAKWQCHARGSLILSHLQEERSPRVELEAIQQRCQEKAMANFYDQVVERGINYGAAFQGIKRRWEGEGEALVELKLDSESINAHGYHIHPALLDSSFQALANGVLSEALPLTVSPQQTPNIRRRPHVSSLNEKFTSFAVDDF